MKTKHIQYQTHGTCSQLIDVTADENNVIQQVFFLGGCNGNLQGISQLVRGQKIDDVIPKINGIRCGTKGTSCPDQLCRALEQLRNAPLEDAESEGFKPPIPERGIPDFESSAIDHSANSPICQCIIVLVWTLRVQRYKNN